MGETYKKQKNPVPLKKDGTPYSSVPLRPVLEKHILRCCCTQFWCSIGIPMENGGIQRHCPIECKQLDGSYYPMNDTGLCTCPLCNCDCRSAFPYGMEAVIQTNERLLKQGENDINNQVKRDKDLFNTMKDIISQSDQMATNCAESTLNQIKKEPEKYQTNESMVDYINDTFYKSKAQNAISKLQGISPEILYELGKVLGNKTDCPIPGGTIDARSINMRQDRLHNNRLNSTTNDVTDQNNGTETTPLMQSKLKSSFHQVTDDFLSASKKFTPAASAIDKVKGSREKKKQERQTKLAEECLVC